jgi:hypothetical protein
MSFEAVGHRIQDLYLSSHRDDAIAKVERRELIGPKSKIANDLAA